MKKLLYLLPLFLVSCGEKIGDTNQLPIAEFVVMDKITKFVLQSTTIDADSDDLTYNWSLNSDLIRIEDPSKYYISISLSDIAEEVDVDVTLEVCDQEGCDVVSQTITLPVMTKLRKWGLGVNLEYEKSNDCTYEWYIDALTIGPDVYDAPCVAVMAAKWADADMNKTTSDFLESYPGVNNWWDLADIHGFLADNNIQRDFVEIDNTTPIVEEINNGNIVILLLDMQYITENKEEEERVGRHYWINAPYFGLSIIVKGYKIVDGNTYLEVYDPLSMGYRYNDNTLMGKDRYFRSGEVMEALNNWNPSMTVVHKKK